MPWSQIHQFNPYEQWQFTSVAIAFNTQYFKFEWVTADTPRLRNYIAQSDDGINLFDIKKLISGDKSSVFYLPSPSIWVERKIAILCPRIWASALPSYKVNLFTWQ